MDDNISKIPAFFSPEKHNLFSYVHNTDTFVHFNNEMWGSDEHKNSFIQVNYRIKNLQLVKKLKNCKFKDHDSIKKTIKGLHCCSTLSKIEVTKRKNASLKRTSQKCRRSCCPRCNE